MSEIRKLVVGETTETIIRVLFDHRISQESDGSALNIVSRAQKIRDLRSQIIGFVKRNPNAVFELVVPEFKSEKKVKLTFSNFVSPDLEEDEDIANYKILVSDNFVDGEIINKVKIGKDIVIKIKAE